MVDLRPPLDLVALETRARKPQHAPYIEADLMLALLAHCRAGNKAMKNLHDYFNTYPDKVTSGQMARLLDEMAAVLASVTDETQ